VTEEAAVVLTATGKLNVPVEFTVIAFPPFNSSRTLSPGASPATAPETP
jgi:hypothetical protein